MARLAEGSNFTPVDEGTYPARVISYVYLGTQESDLFGSKRQCAIEFELPTELQDDGSPQRLIRFCTHTVGKKSTLRGIIEGVQGRSLTPEESKGYNPSSLLGQSCMLSVTHKETDGDTRARISTVTAVPKGMKVSEAKTPLLDYDFEEDGPDIPSEIPDFLADIIRRSPDYQQ